MDANDFQSTIEASMAVELDRLGSSKLLVALTDADLSEATVLRIAAESERAAMETFERWADDEAQTDAGQLFAECREQERDHYERIADLLEGEFEGDGGPVDPMHDCLRSLESTIDRLGGLVGRALVGGQTQLQLVSFFVNEGDERRADCFRELRAETAAQGDRAAELLETVCDGSEDWEQARRAAEAVIDVAYDAYADSLDDLGLDPKPIC